MSEYYHYNNDNVFYLNAYNACDDDVGWYAASPSNMEAGLEPNDGPFKTEEEAIARAEELAVEERDRDEKLNSTEWAYEADFVVYTEEKDSLEHLIENWYRRLPRAVEA